jgi:hypothetical protein
MEVMTAHQKILEIVLRETARLRGISDRDAATAPAPGKWCRKEILGHLVDSAGNNLQRVVRAQQVEMLEFPGYAQNDWVRCQGYAEEEWGQIIDLWVLLNRHLAHVVERIAAQKAATMCVIGGGAPMTLDAMVVDYLRHLEHHLEQM